MFTTVQRRSGYLPIAGYGLVGDGHTAALVGLDGSIDFACWPRFDSPAQLCRLLDASRGGYLRVGPTAPYQADRAYVPDTNVLETRFRTASGEVTVTDFMPLPGGTGRLHRRVAGVRGEVGLEVRFRPAFEFAAGSHTVEHRADGVVARGGREWLAVVGMPLRPDADTLAAPLRLRAGDVRWLALEHGRDGGGPTEVDADASAAQLDATTRGWRDWVSRCGLEGPYRDLVARSVLALGLLVYRPTGAMVAAPTTSLPEGIGGVRNWDYRFAWLRDAALVLNALQGVGLHEEAMAFWGWLEGLCLRCGCPVHNLYRVDGSPRLPEVVLPHLEGYRGSRPVRVGNAAADQLQLDLYGHVLDAAWLCITSMRTPHPDLEPILRWAAEQAASRWTEPDEGIWEVRGGRRHFTHSKLYCWVALDRALRLADAGWLAGEVTRWRTARDAISAAILSEGFDPTLGAFTRSFGSPSLDASALLVPAVGFLPGDDPRVASTVDAIRAGLVRNGLVDRYHADDGLPGGEGAFLPCTFWLASALALGGRLDDARDVFERAARCANDLGLMAEEVDPVTGELLGNFPQGFSHLALVRSALLLGGRSTEPRICTQVSHPSPRSCTCPAHR